MSKKSNNDLRQQFANRLRTSKEHREQRASAVMLKQVTKQAERALKLVPVIVPDAVQAEADARRTERLTLVPDSDTILPVFDLPDNVHLLPTAMGWPPVSEHENDCRCPACLRSRFTVVK